MKYVIGLHPVLGWPLPAVFDESINHCDVADALRRSMEDFQMTIRSAGFVYINDLGGVVVSDRPSGSLGIGPRPDDILVLIPFLLEGLSGLSLLNRTFKSVLGAGAKP